MTNILSRLPTVQYNGYLSANLLNRVAAVRDHLGKYEVYHSYVIKEGERPDTIAYDYYDNSEYAWLVMIPNDIYDIYSDWPLSNDEFKDHLRTKYGKIHELMSQVSHYEYQGITGETREEVLRKNWKMTTETWESLSPEDRSGWSPVMIYDYEVRLNDLKRNIRLLSNEYLPLIKRELELLF